jgi:hypothetical protein
LLDDLLEIADRFWLEDAVDQIIHDDGSSLFGVGSNDLSLAA